MENKETNSATTPYVSYRISAQIKEKGIGHNVKNTIKSFFDSRGVSHKIKDTKISSKEFDCVVELHSYENDYNIHALSQHLDSSGRIPDKKGLKPTFSITAVPYEYFRPSIEEYKNVENTKVEDIVWQKTVKDLESKIRAGEKQIDDLSRALGERQKVIDSQNNKIQTLEKIIKKPSTDNLKNPIEFILETCYNQSSEHLINAIADYDKLQGLDYNFYKLYHRQKLNFLNFINLIAETNFTNELEFHAWKKRLGDCEGKFEKSEDGREITKKLTKIEADREILELAKKSGADEEIIKLADAKVSGSKLEYQRLKNSYEKLHDKFLEHRNKYFNVMQNEEFYEPVLEVIENAKFRREAGANIPIFTRVKTDREKHFMIYYPNLFGFDAVLERDISQEIGSFLIDYHKYKMEKNKFGEFGTIAIVSPIKEKQKDYDFPKIMEKIKKGSKIMNNDPLFNFLGIPAKVFSIVEN